MDGISNLIGTRDVAFELYGKKFKMRVLALEDYAEIESYIISLRPDPFQLLADAPPELREKMYDRAWKDASRSKFVSREEYETFERSLHGTAYIFWRQIREHHPEIATVDDAVKFLERAGREGQAIIDAALMKVHERDILGNSDGRAKSPAAQEDQVSG